MGGRIGLRSVASLVVRNVKTGTLEKRGVDSPNPEPEFHVLANAKQVAGLLQVPAEVTVPPRVSPCLHLNNIS
jgi:hypothetical protein